MLHELLLALYGVEGNIYMKHECGNLAILDNLPFVSPAETSLLNRLCELGTYYKRFDDFIQHFARPISGRSNGLYKSAFAFALSDALESYRQTLTSLEQELLADPHMSLSHVQCRLERYHLIFPILWNVIDHFVRHKSRGCQIIDVVYKNIPYGLVEVRDTLIGILHKCNRVFYRQLSSWMLRGILLDHYQEFFIQQLPETDSGRYSRNKPNSDDENEEALIDQFTKTQLDRLTGNRSMLASNRQFSLRPEMLPSYIPVTLAEQILFIGEAVHLFESDPSQTVQTRRNPAVELLINELETEFANELFELGNQYEFSLLRLQEVVEKIRSFITRRLWVLFVDEHGLIEHLRQVKDIYLFGRGEVFLAFIDMVTPQLTKLPNASTEHDVNIVFQKAARSILLDDESLVAQFQFAVVKPEVVDENDDSSKEDEAVLQNLESSWDYLEMRYHVHWPFHLLFPNTTLEKYSQLFKFLLMAKRTQLALQSCWAIQRLHKGRNDSSIMSSRQWLLRNHMAFLVDNFQYYLQVDVIESLFSELIKEILASEDVEQIQQAHHCFITNLLGQSFLYNRPIYHCVRKLLSVCLAFSAVVHRNMDPSRKTDIDAKVAQLQKVFQRRSALLFNILSNVQNQLQTSPHLAQLLLRLDFNKYYSTSGGTLGK